MCKGRLKCHAKVMAQSKRRQYWANRAGVQRQKSCDSRLGGPEAVIGHEGRSEGIIYSIGYSRSREVEDGSWRNCLPLMRVGNRPFFEVTAKLSTSFG